MGLPCCLRTGLLTKKRPASKDGFVNYCGCAWLRAGGSVLLGVVLMVIALVRIVDVLTRVVFVVVALVDVMHMARLIAVMLVIVALVDIVNVLAGVMFVIVALVGIVGRSYHS